MGAITLISVEEYLTTVYEPDCDYVDGEVLERNVGEKDHGKLQKKLLRYLEDHYPQFFTIQEQRVQVSRSRFRVPDVCLVAGPEPEEQIFRTPPFLCIGILSPEDRMSRMLEKIRDYLSFGVSWVWILDPRTRLAEIYTAAGPRPVEDGVLRTANPEILVPLDVLWEPVLRSGES
jgi:Uma2 family endonuclease